jgi:hypothetical protein
LFDVLLVVEHPRLLEVQAVQQAVQFQHQPFSYVCGLRVECSLLEHHQTWCVLPWF